MVLRIGFAFWILLCAVGASATSGPKIEFPVVDYKLDNGLRVILQPDSSVPLAVVQLWFRVGSKDEGGGPQGLAHLFEHMMFKGTKRFPKGKYEHVIEVNGGQNNAFTSRDITGYHVQIPSAKLESILEIEADRMTGLVMEKDSLDRELEVVKEERRMRTDNVPTGIAVENLFNTFFKGSPYGWLPIGSMADINSINMTHAESFYRTHYAPNNAVLVIVGDIGIEKTKYLVQKYFGGLMPSKLPDLKWQDPVARKAPVRLSVKRKVEAPLLFMAFPGVKAESTDHPALELAGDILGRGTSSRLYRELVYKRKLVTSVSVGPDSDEYAGVFIVFATLRDRKNLAEVRRVIDAELRAMRAKMVSDAELRKVKVQSEKDYLDSLKTFMGRSEELASFEITFGDYKKLFSRPAEYDAVTAAKIKEVANKYFDFKRSVSVEVVSP